MVARVYNLGLSLQDSSQSLSGEMVWNAFYLHALLSDAERRNENLQLPHHGSQDKHFAEALCECNQHMKGTGQPLWAHACDGCERVTQPPEGTNGTWSLFLFLSPCCIKYTEVLR